MSFVNNGARRPLVAWLLVPSLVIAVGAAAQPARDPSGMNSNEIRALQQRLTDGGCYQGAIDGQASPALDAAVKACPTQDPILRIETGMHTAVITQIGADHACRIAATGSQDKTVRVWSLPDGQLLRTLRVPIGAGDGGKIYATAVSPDGRWIGAGGWDAQQDITNQSFVYIFDAASAAMVARVGPVGGVIEKLAFSPDGRWLAAISIRNVGLKVIDAQTWRIVAEDNDYAGDGSGAAFGPDGYLYTAALDGKLRQYGIGPRFHKEREIKTGGGRQAFSVSVDPSGQLVAVGFNDSAQVDIYDARTLRFRYAAVARGGNADARDGRRGDLAKVAWSSDGERLFAAGGYQARFQDVVKFPVLVFDREGHSIGNPVPLSQTGISDLQRCGDSLLVATDEPAVGLIGRNGQVSFLKNAVEPDMRHKVGDAFTIAPDAKRVRFGLGFGGAEPVLFDLVQATVAAAPDSIPNFVASSVAPTASVARTLAHLLQQNDVVRSIAIRPDQTGFVVGTSYFLLAFPAQGRRLWYQRVPGEAWGVNLSADGRIVVAAYDDGTIRWHRWSDGKELLALFVNRETKTWVAWTPTGYYMASPGGEDLIGWHLNRGWNQAADFFPASRFRDRFNRPDIVRLVLDTLDEDAAIKQANEIAKLRADTRPLAERLPPIIRIAGPADGAHVQNNAVTLDYVLRSPAGKPVNRIDLLINGRPIKAFGMPIEALASDAERKGSIPVTLTQHVSEVGLIAWSAGLASQTVQAKVTWDGAPEATRKLHALVIGVSHYADPAMALKYAAKDANDFAKVLREQKERYYADVEVRVLADEAVTRANLIHGLEWLEQMATNPNDVSVLFLAGHGMTDEKQTYWFYTADATDDDVRIKGVSQDELRKSLEGLQGKVLWFLDTCHAGTAGKRPRVDINVLANTVSASENGGIVVFASSTGRQVSLESSTLGNGAFTKAVVEGIERGEAARRDGLITTSTLDSYVTTRVGEFTDNQQTPVMQRPPEQPDFAIAAAAKP
jgi:caspase domain-containing protein/WD40 domain-containing protein